MIAYVRDNDCVRTGYIAYVRDNYCVRTGSLLRTYGIMIAYVRDHDCVRTRSWLRTYGIMIAYVRDNDCVRTGYIAYVRDNYCVRTGSLLRTYGIMIAYIRDNYPVRTGYCHYFFFFLCPLWVFVETTLPSENTRLFFDNYMPPPPRFQIISLVPFLQCLVWELQAKWQYTRSDASAWPALFQRCGSVVDNGPTLRQHWVFAICEMLFVQPIIQL